MATDDEVRAALKQLMDYYAPKDMKPERLAVYRQQLAALDADVLQRAVAKCLTSMTWFPKLNELFGIANALPVQAEAGNLLRARAFELERKRAEGTFIESEWKTLADSFRRLDKPNARQAVLDRVEAFSGSEYDTTFTGNGISGDAIEINPKTGTRNHD